MGSWYVYAAIIVGVLFPAYAMFDGKNVRRLLMADPTLKTQVFISTAIHLIAISIISLVPFWIESGSLGAIGLNFLSNPLQVAGLFALSFGGLWFFARMNLTPETARKLQSEDSPALLFMPTTRKEYKLGVLVSFVAGICEEIVYRGFLLWFLSNHLPIVAAIILANLPFAMAHVTTTGMKNSLQVFLLSLVFTAAYLITQSLWLPILLHILVDLYAVTVTFKASQMLKERAPE